MSDKQAERLARLIWGSRYAILKPDVHRGQQRGYRVGVYQLATESIVDEQSGEGDSWEEAFLDAGVDPQLVEVYARPHPETP